MINPQSVFAQAGDPPSSPNAWTANVCSGEAAIVVQGREEQGDGVTVAYNDPEGCESDAALGWYVVEPWQPEEMNPDAGCLAQTWSAVGVMAQQTSWVNGSAWRVNNAKFAEHPMVVACSSVNGPDDLGLNPNENQVQLSRQDWVVARAIELLGEHDMTPTQYCSEYDEPLAGYLCAIPAFTSAEIASASIAESDAGDVTVGELSSTTTETFEQVRDRVCVRPGALTFSFEGGVYTCPNASIVNENSGQSNSVVPLTIQGLWPTALAVIGLILAMYLIGGTRSLIASLVGVAIAAVVFFAALASSFVGPVLVWVIAAGLVALWGLYDLFRDRLVGVRNWVRDLRRPVVVQTPPANPPANPTP